MVRAPMFLVFKRNAYFCNTVVNISMYCIKKKKYKSNKNTKPKLQYVVKKIVTNIFIIYYIADIKEKGP